MFTRRRHLLSLLGLGACPLPSPAAPALMQGRDAPPGIDPAGYLVSEKLDGVRALWDGRRLRFRSGLPIAVPDGFVRGLPGVALDGELWLGRGRFEALSGIVRRARADEAAWRGVSYRLFDLPGAPGPFSARAQRLQRIAEQVASPWLCAVAQQRVADPAALQRRLQQVLAGGGEGLMLHRADALWTPGRSDALLKLKPHRDADAVVLGAVPGRGRLRGRMGALRVRTPEGRVFLLGSGFSDTERRVPPAPGSVVTYRYRGLTEAGLPRFASFLRLRALP
jgi:DNA ligase-1